MTVDEFLSPEHVAVNLRVNGKAALLEELARQAGRGIDLDYRIIHSALEKRENLGSTGVGDGIALPHARLEAMRKPFSLLVRPRDAIDFDAVDERPVDLVFLLLLPASPQGAQLNALACVARRMRDPEVAAAMRSARDAATLYAALCGASDVGLP
ncbi:PTS sugar transporter subunit IIA [uncultured Methylobacterium sp.]|uniref:PTS sugar transporter subunit IIA n=1 Tax=uncultured Methylobacterium sp. TaxID=157278 RepID=UPI0035C94EC1